MIGNLRAALLPDRFYRSIGQAKLNSPMRKLTVKSDCYLQSLRVAVRAAWPMRALDARLTAPIFRLNAYRPTALPERPKACL